MSVERSYHLRCDGCAATFDLSGTPGPSGMQRRDARLRGWRVCLPGGRDLCPDCVREGGGAS